MVKRLESRAAISCFAVSNYHPQSLLQDFKYKNKINGKSSTHPLYSHIRLTQLLPWRKFFFSCYHIQTRFGLLSNSTHNGSTLIKIVAEKRSWPSGDKAKHMWIYTSTHPVQLHDVMLKPMDNLSVVSSRVICLKLGQQHATMMSIINNHLHTQLILSSTQCSTII
jgi:hypothetical protein